MTMANGQTTRKKYATTLHKTKNHAFGRRLVGDALDALPGGIMASRTRRKTLLAYEFQLSTSDRWIVNTPNRIPDYGTHSLLSIG
jgi:hypothetical protein